MRTIHLPKLGGMPANVTGILPLAALIDFTDPKQILHFYQLSGRGMMWNWVITPACARLILSHDGTGTCCLDEGSAVPPLMCLDGRWGDLYHCSNPSTIRACMGVAALKKIKIDPSSCDQCRAGPQRVQSQPLWPQPLWPQPVQPQRLRPQSLRIILVLPAEGKGIKGRFWDSVWYEAIASVSGLVFLTTLITTIVTKLYIATSYLIVVLLTGVIIHFSYGRHARLITKQEPPPFSRLVLVADNFNEDEWTAFIGPNVVLNPLLNKPLQQINPPTPRRLWQLQRVLFALVALQWGLTIIASGYQDWDAFVVFAWIALCELTSSFLYSEHSSAKSWLESNGLRLKGVDAELSFRSSMLSLLVALNPDTSIHTSSGQKWIDPFLAPSDEDRIEWEKALLGCLQKDGWDERIRACYDSGLLFHPCCSGLDT